MDNRKSFTALLLENLDEDERKKIKDQLKIYSRKNFELQYLKARYLNNKYEEILKSETTADIRQICSSCKFIDECNSKYSPLFTLCMDCSDRENYKMEISDIIDSIPGEKLEYFKDMIINAGKLIS